MTLAKPTSSPLPIAEGGDDDVGPELGAVLTDAPPLVFEAADTRRDLQLVLRKALGHFVVRVEGRKVPADNFRCLISLDALRAGVPCRDVATWVEHEDGVITNGFDEKAEAFLAAPQLLLLETARREITSDLGKANELPQSS